MTTNASAVPALGVDAGLAWHYGDPLREQRILSEAAGVVVRANRDVVQVSGPDRLGWLHTICSQHLTDRGDGEATEALVLSPHGHVEQHWQVTESDGTVWLDTEPGAAPLVLDYLTKMRFLKRVEPVDAGAAWAVVSVLGPAAAAALPVVPAPGHAVASPSGGFVRAMPYGFDLLVPRASVDAEVAALGLPLAGTWAFDALRVAALRPRLDFETDHRTIPHEVGWIGTAVHLNKGCYRGQETVARVQNLGKPPRRMVMLHLSGDSDHLPEQGSPVESGGRTVGFVGTAVHHYELGPIALAVVKRALVEGTASPELTAAGAPVALAR